MIVQNHLPFPFMTQVFHQKFGQGEDRLVMDGGTEEVPGPVILLVPDEPPRHFDAPGIYHVTPQLENLSERIISLNPRQPKVVWWVDDFGQIFGLRLWHFKLKMRWST